jgi:hypothetical protein
MGTQVCLDYYKICEHFLIPLYQILFFSPESDMIDKVQDIIWRVGDWYLLEYGTYIKIYGATKAPHMLSKFIPDMLVLEEITYHMVIHRIGTTLNRDKKTIWTPLLLWVCSY